jgi:hypothetical protein
MAPEAPSWLTQGLLLPGSRSVISSLEVVVEYHDFGLARRHLAAF